MKIKSSSSILSLALTASLLGAAVWSTDSHACAGEPLISSVCIMAMPTPGRTMNGFVLAWGQQLQVNQNQALFSLIGTTFGGTGSTSFNVPDLRGRVVVGSGTSPQLGQFTAGQSGGATSTVLTPPQLPQHNHTLVGATVDISKMTATTTLSGLTASVTGNAKLKASTGGNVGNDPTGKSLATTTTGGPLKIYSDAAPTITMNTSSIDSSGLTVGNFTGSAATTLGGTASVSGSTAIAGASAPVSLMQPYLVMNYYIATLGLYPQFE